MTIEEKVREIILNLYIVADDNLCRGLRQFDSGDEVRVGKAVQAILALMKPMSRGRIENLIYESDVNQWAILGLKSSLKSGFQEAQVKGNIRKLADAILAEWGKG